MPSTIKVIPHRVWRHTSGKAVSLYGACPWQGNADKGSWKIEDAGFTWEVIDYLGNVTVGLGRLPAPTKEDAAAIAEHYARCCNVVVI